MHISLDPKVLHFQRGEMINNGYCPSFILSDGALEVGKIFVQRMYAKQ